MATVRFIALLLVLAALTLFAAGCGGSGDSSGAAPGGETSKAAKLAISAAGKNAFLKEADAICEATDATQKTAASAFAKKHPQAEKKKGAAGRLLIEVGLPPVVKEVEELGQLTPPPGDEAAYGKIIAGIEAAITATEAEPEAVAFGKALPFAAVEKEAAAYGFEACSSPL